MHEARIWKSQVNKPDIPQVSKHFIGEPGRATRHNFIGRKIQACKSFKLFILDRRIVFIVRKNGLDGFMKSRCFASRRN